MWFYFLLTYVTGVTYQPEDGVIQSQREKELIEILIDKIAQLVPGGGDMCEAKDPKAALLQESEDMGRQKVTLQVLYDRCVPCATTSSAVLSPQVNCFNIETCSGKHGPSTYT